MITKSLIKSDTVDDCLKQFESIVYECYGHAVIFLYYDYTFEQYEILFRNPSKINNNELSNRDKSPLLSCHKTIDFINNNPHLFTNVI